MIYLVNSPILTTDGSYKLQTISLDDARKMVTAGQYTSAIGHQSTADIMSTLLGVKIAVDRIRISQMVGDQVLVFALKGRPDIGADLTVDQLTDMGYTFKLLTRIE